MSTQAPKPVKGILKMSSQPTSSPAATKSNLPNAEEAMRIAVHHATLIHQQRELEDIISDSIIDLAKLPLYHESEQPPFTAANPHPSDAAVFTSHIRLFQPTDYEDLIEERNILNRCGYVLCPKPRTKVTQAGEWKLVGYGTKDFNIVPKGEIEKWCGQKCARRAMYIKVQLNETAAWERAGIPEIKIELLEEPDQEKERADKAAKAKRTDAAAKIADDLAKLRLEAQKKSAQNTRDLALERGDNDEAKAARRDVEVTIREKKVVMEAKEPSLGQDQDPESHLVLDGYKPKFDPKSETVPRPVTAEEAAVVRAKMNPTET